MTETTHEDLSVCYAGALTCLLTVPTRLRHHRNRRAISLRTAAAEIGIAFNTLTRVEHGEVYTDEVLRKILIWIIEQEKLSVL